ncbi:PREDICTED: caprin-2-like [Cyprinodon variegatus]|uniref:Cerebellin 18 n=1 Tax=Cyprinodon variegatus TaxID=28743 RepID=A0A3Q2D5I4_CYPVA|nr:PREDICTED: caprin-2-like [Cyprinodon variegatus]
MEQLSKKMGVLAVVFLLGSLFLSGCVEAVSSSLDALKLEALQWEGSQTCGKWDCTCPFYRQRGCCCAANDLFQVEDESFMRIKNLWEKIPILDSRVNALSDGFKVSFMATMTANMAIENFGSPERCFGPFNTNVPIPYPNVTLNSGDRYNPALGVFTASCPGVYMFSFTVYSSVAEGGRLYHKVQLMKNGKVGVSVWENNREDIEDSATQVVVMEMQRGDQVYLELMSGRKLCTKLEHNIFTGHILYPYTY